MSEYRIELVKVDEYTVVSRKVPVLAEPAPQAEPASPLAELLDASVVKITASLPDLTTAQLHDLRALEVGGKTRASLLKIIDAELAAREA